MKLKHFPSFTSIKFLFQTSSRKEIKSLCACLSIDIRVVHKKKLIRTKFTLPNEEVVHKKLFIGLFCKFDFHEENRDAIYERLFQANRGLKFWKKINFVRFMAKRWPQKVIAAVLKYLPHLNYASAEHSTLMLISKVVITLPDRYGPCLGVLIFDQKWCNQSQRWLCSTKSRLLQTIKTPKAFGRITNIVPEQNLLYLQNCLLNT